MRVLDLKSQLADQIRCNWSDEHQRRIVLSRLRANLLNTFRNSQLFAFWFSPRRSGISRWSVFCVEVVIRDFPNQMITLQLLRGSMPVLSPSLYYRRSSNAANFLLASWVSIGLGSGSLLLFVIHTIRLFLGSAGLSDQFSHRAVILRFRNHAFLRITFLPHSDEFCRSTSDSTLTHWRPLRQCGSPAFVHLVDSIPILVQVEKTYFFIQIQLILDTALRPSLSTNGAKWTHPTGTQR